MQTCNSIIVQSMPSGGSRLEAVVVMDSVCSSNVLVQLTHQDLYDSICRELHTIINYKLILVGTTG